jgi:hypothetical protein
MPSARAPDLRRIRTSMTYDVSEIADLFGIHTNTVHNWIKAGLEVIPDTRPALIYGECLKLFLKRLRQSRKKTCHPNQMFCCRCKSAQQPVAGTVSIHRQQTKSLTLCGKCEVCALQMYRGGSVSRLDEYTKAFGQITTGKPDI